MEAVLQRENPELQMDDASLVRMVQSGEVQAFEYIVRRYQERVYNTCWRICRRPEDARDLTQETFLKAFAGIDSFKFKSQFYTWLFRIAVNLTRSHLKKFQLRLVGSLDGQDDRMQPNTGPPVADRLPDHRTAGPTDQAERNELRRCVASALQSLEDHHRIIVVLRDIEGFNYEQMAAVLEIPVGTVKSRVHRARLALREGIERFYANNQRKLGHL